MAEEKKAKAWRLEVIGVDGSDENFTYQYDSATEACHAAEQIIKQGYAVKDWSKDETTPYSREYRPLHRIRSLDVVAKD